MATTETIAEFFRRNLPVAPVPAGVFEYSEARRDLMAPNADHLADVSRANLLRALEVVGHEMGLNLAVAVRFRS